VIALTRVVYKLLNSVQRNLNNGNVFFPNIAGMGFGFLVTDISDNPVAIGLFGAISVVVGRSRYAAEKPKIVYNSLVCPIKGTLKKEYIP